MPKKKVNFGKTDVPVSYRCQHKNAQGEFDCNKDGVRLYVEAGVFDSCALCAEHAAEIQGLDYDMIVGVKINGKQYNGAMKNVHGRYSFRIGAWYSAVPNNGNGPRFCPIQHLPHDGMKWWKRLPIGRNQDQKS